MEIMYWIYKKTFTRTSINCADGISDIIDFGNTEQYLINVFNKESNICLVCIETIGPKDAVSATT